MNQPLVTVICLCYNHELFVREAIESVFNQDYPDIQLVVVDDGSTDRSVDVIRDTLVERPEVIFLALRDNMGNCRAFNKGFAEATGMLIVDLAADDALLPTRIREGVSAFDQTDGAHGINFSDAELVDAKGAVLGYHSDRFPHDTIPEGDIYKNIISRYFINSPTMMIRREVLEALGGYDESLAYEDFDLWVRASRNYTFSYTPKPLVRRRVLASSMSRNQYRQNSPQLFSTFKIMEKIRLLNRSEEENKLLRRRILYEMRRAIRVGELRLAAMYLKLWKKV